MEDHAFYESLGCFYEVRMLMRHRAAFGCLVAKPYTVTLFIEFDKSAHEVGLFFGCKFFEIMYMPFRHEHEMVIYQVIIPHSIWESVSNDIESSEVFYEVLIGFVKGAKFTL